MPKPIFHLTPSGYFARGEQRIIPVGVNYWPGSCGVEMWQRWPAREIQHDLDTMVALGFNCVRFFVRWQDFEPTPGHYNATAFKRLDTFLKWCAKRKLLTQPSLFVGWMSGGIFWPEWKAGRNLFADPTLRRRGFAFAGRVARALAPHRQTILAVDQGNEICCLPDCLEASPADVISWCAGVNRAVRRAYPDCLIISGNEQAQITSDTGWRFDAQEGCDLYSMHTYPNGAWHSLSVDGMTDPLTASLFPFYLKCARAFGPVMMQEFGTIFTLGECCDTYLRAMLPAAWEAGANGFLWWSLRDFSAPGHPYNKNGFEGPLGIANDLDELKPTLRVFGEFIATLADRPEPVTDQGDVALYWPLHYYDRDEPLNPGNVPQELSRRLVIAHYTLTELGHRVGIVRGDQPLTDLSAHTIVITGASLTAREVEHLQAWVEGGGRVLWHGVDLTTCGVEINTLLGADATDLYAPSAPGVHAFGATWNFSDFAKGVFTGFEPRTAEVVAADLRQRPVVLAHNVGQGRVVACLAQPDEDFARHSADRDDRPRWARWYRGMLRALNPSVPKRRKR